MAIDACSGAQFKALLLGCLCIFSMGGLVFGVSSVFDDLYSIYAFEGICMPREEACPRDGQPCCNMQLQILSLFSSVGFFVADGAAAPWGEIVDRLGPRRCLGWAAALSVTGLIRFSP